MLGELWGLCEPCNRWFFVAHEPGVGVRSPRCPICAALPAEVELRVVSTA